jgi:hypothetical protein
MKQRIQVLSSFLLIAALSFSSSCHTLGFNDSQVQAFSSPESAGDALTAAIRQGDDQALLAILGSGYEKVLSSGDPVLDQEEQERFLAAYDAQHGWLPWDDGIATLQIGQNGWIFPIPLLEDGDGWRFDLAEGKDELLSRRIGENELNTIQACLAFVDAEREYYQSNPQGKAQPEFARFILSTEGHKDGLYWATAESETPSPLGSLYAGAQFEGYEFTQGELQPFHGYLFRVLQSQGPNAPGGAFDYIKDGSMTEGFALIAWPATYGESGIQSFLVNHVGLVYEQDLGEDTGELAVQVKSFDPDGSWHLVSKEDTDIP